MSLSEPPLAFSHSPGCMFLTDIPDSPTSTITPPTEAKPHPELTPLCFQVSQNPLLYSLVSQGTAAKIRQLEVMIGEDPGRRPRMLFFRSE